MARVQYKYGEKDTEKFVLACARNGGNVKGTARDLGIPYSSARALYAKSGMEPKILEVRKKQFVGKSWKVMFKILRILESDLTDLPETRIRAYKELLATLYDKQNNASVAQSIQDVSNMASKSVAGGASSEANNVVSKFEQSLSSGDQKETLKISRTIRTKGTNGIGVPLDVDSEEVEEAREEEATA